MSAYSLVEQELAARLAKLEENYGAMKAEGSERSGESGTFSARIKTVEGQVTDLAARLDAIEGETPKKSTGSTTKRQ